MDENLKDDAMLNDLFAAAVQHPAPASPALLARVLRDGETHQPRAAVTRPPARRSLFGGVMSMIGGWPALAGLAAATVAGVWLGASNLAPIDAGLSAYLDSPDEMYFSEVMLEPQIDLGDS